MSKDFILDGISSLFLRGDLANSSSGVCVGGIFQGTTGRVKPHVGGSFH